MFDLNKLCIDCFPISTYRWKEREVKSGTPQTREESSYLCFIQKRLNSLSSLLLSSLGPLSWRDNFRPANRNTPTPQAVTGEALWLNRFNLRE